LESIWNIITAGSKGFPISGRRPMNFNATNARFPKFLFSRFACDFYYKFRIWQKHCTEHTHYIINALTVSIYVQPNISFLNDEVYYVLCPEIYRYLTNKSDKRRVNYIVTYIYLSILSTFWFLPCLYREKTLIIDEYC